MTPIPVHSSWGKKSKKGCEVYISPYCRQTPVPPNFMKFGIRGQITDVMMCVKFLVDRFRGYGVLTPQYCHFPLACCVALTTVYALPCNTVIYKDGCRHKPTRESITMTDLPSEMNHGKIFNYKVQKRQNIVIHTQLLLIILWRYVSVLWITVKRKVTLPASVRP